MGYEGFFAEKTQQTYEGVAIFCKSSRFRIISSHTIELSSIIEDLLTDDVRKELNGFYRTGHVLAMACIKPVKEGRSFVIGKNSEKKLLILYFQGAVNIF
jgi:hypothetical protein